MYPSIKNGQEALSEQKQLFFEEKKITKLIKEGIIFVGEPYQMIQHYTHSYNKLFGHQSLLKKMKRGQRSSVGWSFNGRNNGSTV